MHYCKRLGTSINGVGYATDFRYLLLHNRNQCPALPGLEDETRAVASRPLGVFERPAAAQGFVKLNDRKPAPGLDLRERVFRGKELLLSLENFVIARFAFLVAVGRHRHGLATGIDGLGLLNAFLVKSAVGYERVGHFTEGGESGVLVLKLRFFAGGFGLTIAPRQPVLR